VRKFRFAITVCLTWNNLPYKLYDVADFFFKLFFSNGPTLFCWARGYCSVL